MVESSNQSLASLINETAIPNIKVEQALILSEDNEEPQDVGGIPVVTRSIAEWLLED